jgi:hypothetical protein
MIRDDLNRLIKPKPPEKKLVTASNPSPIRSQTGLERKQVGSNDSEVVTVISTDGLFTFTVRVLSNPNA